MPEGSLTNIDDKILVGVIEKAKSEKIGDFDKTGAPVKPFERYLEQLVRYATGEDAIWENPASLLNRAESAWTHAAVRMPFENKVGIKILDGRAWMDKRLVLDIVTDDKPFLVDSISAALADLSKPVSFFSNAVVDVQRDEKGVRRFDIAGRPIRESMIHAEMDPPVDDAEIDQLKDEIDRVLQDVTDAVADWEPMRARLAASIAQLERSRLPGLRSDEQREAIEFLKWLWDNRFAFLGYRRFDAVISDDDITFDHDAKQDLGILKDPTRRILRGASDRTGTLTEPVKAFLRSNEPVIVAKSNAKSLVHRRTFLDYVGVKTYSVDGAVSGEDRFVGLFTSDAYYRPAADIPLIRAKIKAVVDSTDFTPGGHNEKALINIVETYPRDELFQIDVETLRDISLGILRLYKRPRAKLFLRRDRFDRFVSALVFIPRDRFNSDIREQVGALLADAFAGEVTSFSPSFGDAALVRVHFIIAINPGAPEGPGVAALTTEIRKLIRNWSDALLEALRRAHDGVTPTKLYQKYVHAFDAGYRERSVIAETLRDIGALEKLDREPTIIRAYRRAGDSAQAVRLKIYRRGGPFPLSRLIPTIENLGLRVIQETGYQVLPDEDDSQRAWIHDFYTEQNKDQPIALEDVKSGFEETMLAVLDGRTEDDRFNSLVLTAGVDWREAWLLRAIAKYSIQAGFAYSQSYMEDALSNHPGIARSLVAAFHARFNPAGPRASAEREHDYKAASEDVFEALNQVDSLAEDRIFRRFLNTIDAILRTNYYQKDDDGAAKRIVAFKIDSAVVETLPAPRPYREIFVCGPRVDGVHLRFGPVARGGLRWSDRKEDYRTEVLGLVKAQRVKNAVIVPTGSKGGFYPKQLPQSGRAEIYEEGREAYKLFIRGLLDLTDNIVSGEIVRPENMVLWDDPDPYLVVAADKGTAQFSDTANAIAEEYGFWLGDAFASGGSAGYDHKVMGITARGAWEAVKRHFRELGKDIQSEPFTVAGVGDMSGDVFGNGMLLSEKIRLVAAFDHRDIFIDPDPDPAVSYAERKRLFETPRTSWADYDRALISEGGGVFSRAAKSIPITQQMREALDIEDERLTPTELIQAILRAPVELFWLGGIGTYFKAAGEENAKVGDRANDAVRINADEIRAKVIGEGANLGLTQAARIAFARRGGRINTDAIDNSAGVDSSDHEVNIKILLSAAIEQAELKREDRNALLASMTEDVAEHVLRHNYDQTRAISLMERTSAGDLDTHERLMTEMESVGRLDRAVEYLPSTDEMHALRQQGAGLTRPELSVLLAYAKNWIFDELVNSAAPDDPIFERELFGYFPEPLHGFTKPLTQHRLRREIIATRLSNEILDSCGVSFVQRVVEATDSDFAAMALAYDAARGVYELKSFVDAVDALDTIASADLQNALYLEASLLMREQVFRLLNKRDFRSTVDKHGVKSIIQRYRAPVSEFKDALPSVLGAEDKAAFDARSEDWKAAGAPADLARQAASLPCLEHALDIVDIASDVGWSNPGVGGIHAAIGRQYFFNQLREKARTDPPADNFDRISVRQFADDLSVLQRALVRRVIEFAGAEPKGKPADWAGAVVARWEECARRPVTQFRRAVDSLDLNGQTSVGKFALFSKRASDLIANAG